MIAMLGMYDIPALQGANDRLWLGIRGALGHGPDHLTRDRDFWDIWQSPDLLFAQTCGMPFRSRLHPDVTLVGTPDYGLPDCPPGYYNSVLVAHSDAPGTTLADFAGLRFAFNDACSQSGWTGPMVHLNQAGVRFSELVKSGGHQLSALAVAEGRADMAGLDHLTWTLLCDYEPALTARLRVVETTVPTPALPYITAAGRDPAPITVALHTAVDGLSPEDRQLLHLNKVVSIPVADYLAVPTPPEP